MSDFKISVDFTLDKVPEGPYTDITYSRWKTQVSFAPNSLKASSTWAQYRFEGTVTIEDTHCRYSSPTQQL